MSAQSAPLQWTKSSLTTLIHALTLSPVDAQSLLPHSATQISSVIRKISLSLNNPSHWTTQRHTRAVVKRVTGLSAPPKPRRKKLPQAPRHRISVQLIPATPADDAAIRAVGAHPFVEVVLKAGRRVWDVVKHLYQKWGLPVRVEVSGKTVSVDSLVVELVEKGSRTVRLPYRVVRVDIDWRVLKCALEDDVVTVSGKRRVTAPRDDEAFWTGQFDGLSNGLDAGCEYSSQKSEKKNGEETVMSRLRGQLEKLDRSRKASQDEGVANELVEKGDGISGNEGEEDLAVIPERFLRTCSRFEFAHSLPDSLLSLGRSDGSNDGDDAKSKGTVVATPATGNEVVVEAGVIHPTSHRNTDENTDENGGEVNALQVMNDALDLRHDLDLRCDEQLDEADFLHPVFPDVAPPSLSLSALFRD